MVNATLSDGAAAGVPVVGMRSVITSNEFVLPQKVFVIALALPSGVAETPASTDVTAETSCASIPGASTQ